MRAGRKRSNIHLLFFISFLVLLCSPLPVIASADDDLIDEIPILPLLAPVPENSVFTGAARYSIPIEVPPGRNGIEPEITLQYQGSTENGWVGVGWNLDMGAIQRSTKFGVDYSTNDYVYVNSGSNTELVGIGGDQYRAKIEESFARYNLDPSGGWVVTTRDGTKYYYGRTSDSRQQNAHGTFKWCLDRVEDTNANYMDIRYWKDQGQIYLDRIDYTGNTNTGIGGANYIKFIRQTRSDAYTSLRSKAKVRTAWILKQIETYADSQLARKYELTYGHGTTSDRNRLTQWQTFGFGPDGAKSLPPQTFQYHEGGNTTFSLTGSINLEGITVLDVNGDGLADLLTNNNYLGEHTYLSNGDGTFTYNRQTNLNRPGKDHFADLNGDGLTDIIGYVYDRMYGMGTVYSYFSNGNGTFTYKGTTGLPGGSYRPRFIEVNGDGRSDLILVDSDSSRISIYYSNQDGTFTYEAYTNLSRRGADHFADVNGDGLTDIITYYYDTWWGQGELTVYFSNGNGTFTYGGTTTNFPEGGRRSFVDINGDGLTDILITHMESHYSTIYRYLSDGDGSFTYKGGTSLPRLSDIDHFTDVNGDGLVDIITYDYDRMSYTSSVYIFMVTGNGPPDLVTSIDNGNGGITTIEYTSSTKYQNSFLPFITHPVSAITIDDGLGNTSTTEYSYADGLYDPPTREFRGFKYVEQTNPDDSVLETWFHQDEYLKGRSYQTKLSTDAGTLLTKTDLVWETAYLNPPDNTRAFVKLARKRSEFYDGAVVAYSQEDNTYDDTNGYLISQVASGTDAETITTVYDYQNYGAWTWRRTRETLSNELNETIRDSWYEYENGTGNLLFKEFWLNNGPNPRIGMTYDAYGNQVTLTDANNNPPTRTEYDIATHTYPVKIINPLDHVVEYEYDYRFGKVSAEKDANNNWTYYDFDPFGRLKQVEYPDGGLVNTDYYDDVVPRQVISRALENDFGNTIDAYSYFDGLGRKVQTITLGEENKTIVAKTHYDNMGRVYRAEGPFFSTSTGWPIATPAGSPYAETDFDKRGRPVEVRTPLGQDVEQGDEAVTRYTYSGYSTTVEDPDGGKKTETKDYLGRII